MWASAASPQASRFPFEDAFRIDSFASAASLGVLQSDDVIAALAPLLSEERRLRVDAVVAARTFDLVPVVEGGRAGRRRH